MNSRAPAEAGVRAGFDLLRVRIETAIRRPSVIVITSLTSRDGMDITAKQLADSLAAAGYNTLFADASLATVGLVKATEGLTFDEVARLSSTSVSDHPVVLMLNDPSLQRRTSARSVVAALETLRAKFDYVLISAEYSLATPFATSIVDAADAVLVSVKKGRRENSGDAHLFAALDRLGEKFLGVVALDASVFRDEASTSSQDRWSVAIRNPSAGSEKERRRREVAL
jgi:cellulose biosynthesis protein BcsQ